MYYHTNGYGDCVLLDELGPPWPVHECWRIHAEERRRAILQSTWSLVNFGVRNLATAATTQSIHEAVPSTDWWRESLPWDGAQWLRPLPEGFVYYVHPPPPEANLEDAGPFLLLSWVLGRSERMFAPPDPPEMEMAWTGINTGVRGLTVFLPARIAREFRAGDPLVAEIEAVGRPGHCAYVCRRLRTRDGRRLDVTGR